ncbi:hypothetical protein J27TS8_38170 [Robertmurraya siralis]|uniref:DUF7878 domain-containing protein n=1 Tax=Robertmurraya siralis TaxID=77777 RepID=A0A919WLJ4_9BACI|nr:hypothetical protein CHH80_09230 [Bacillus sp. 7504-2]GIN63824.1 hypothetical protein J27TS8_38170 [Robertmurraya siralis]
MNPLRLEFKLHKYISVDRKLIKQRNGKLLVDIQGDFEMYIHNKCFFKEPSLALLELGVALTKWDRVRDFTYYTIEHDEREGPLLTFNNKGEKGWRLFSIWQLFESEDSLSIEMITTEVESFLQDLDEELVNTYGFNIEGFLNRKIGFFGI